MVLKVPQIMCESCREKIASALDARGVKADINVRFKTVIVDDADEKAAREAIESVGYSVEQ